VTLPAPAAGHGWRSLVGTHLELPDSIAPGIEHRLRPFEGLALTADR
jgi:hypothetical protein